jgi:hypothetical protein
MDKGSGFRFVGSEGVMMLGRNITLTRRRRLYDIEPSISTFPNAMQERLLSDYQEKHPEIYREPQVEKTEAIAMPAGSGGMSSHFGTFFEGMRTRKAVVRDSVFGFRAAGPALAANIAYLENRVVNWDPTSVKIKG